MRGSFYSRNWRGAFVYMAMFLFALTLNLRAQVTTSAISGMVKDNNGTPLPGVNIVAVHEPSGTKSGTYSRSDGRFNIPGMRVGGPYTITASMIGYKEHKIENINLALGEDKNLSFVLVEEAVEMEGSEIVAERNPIISDTRTGVAQSVSTKEIENLPTISRSFDDFTRLTPQFSGNSAAGRNNRYNSILIDGAVNNDLFGLAASGTPGGQAGTQPISLDAIQEFQVEIAPYDVRKGGFTGGGINAVTRSGTNKYEGSGYYYFRNESFVGKYENATSYANLDEKVAGFRIGGPIIKDQLFFFVNGEYSTRTTPTPLGILGNGKSNDFTGISSSDAQRAIRILDSVYNYKAGGYGIQDLKRPNTKFFARLDYNLNNQHRLTLRHNFVDASDDNLSQSLSSTSANSGFRLSDAGYEFLSTTNSTVFQVNSVITNELHNEAIIGYSTVRDRRKINGSPFPAINVRIGSNTLIAGSENFSQANSLDQDILEITNNLTYYMGDHTIMAGTHNEFFSFKNVFIRDFYGNYTFSNLDSLAVGSPSSYGLSYSLDTNNLKPSAKFDVQQYGFYVQDMWRVTPTMNVTLGLRFDLPVLPTNPTNNPTVDTTVFAGGLKLKTSEVPSGNLLFSPRLGFNWDVKGNNTTQVRGGIGIFSGRTPYVWISNQYGNTGIEIGRTTTNPGPRSFRTDVNNQPGKVYTAPPSEIDLTDPDFKLPQVYRLNLGVDHELPMGITGTVDFLLSKNKNDILYQDINLVGSSGTLQLSNSGDEDGNRVRYTTTPTSTTVNKIRSQYSNVIYLTNADYGYEYSFTTQLRKSFSAGLFGSFDKGFFASIAYTYGRAFDNNSGTSSQAFSNWRFNPVKQDPNNAPSATSNYETRHRIISSVVYDFEFIPKYTTTVSLFYNGFSGRPYSTTYDGDVNGDGQTSNDLIYVPKDRNDINIVPATASGGAPADTRTADQIWVALDEYISGDPVLRKSRGKIISRNASREPWTNRLDFRLAQEIPVAEQWGKFELTADILNLLNFLNESWGLSEFVNNQNNSAIVYRGIISGKPAFTFGKYNFLTKEYENPKRTQVSDLASRWQLQLGVRYTF